VETAEEDEERGLEKLKENLWEIWGGKRQQHSQSHSHSHSQLQLQLKLPSVQHCGTWQTDDNDNNCNETEISSGHPTTVSLKLLGAWHTTMMMMMMLRGSTVPLDLR